MNSDRNDLSSRDYEREAEATRGRLARNLAELNNRLTPGQVFDEVLTYARGGGGTFLRNLGNAAKANPIPSLLIGAGCMMFMSEKLGLMGHGSNGRRSVSHRRSGDGDYAGREYYGSRAQDGDGENRRYAEQPRTGYGASRMSSAASYAGEQASSMAEGVKHGAQSLGSGVADAAGYARDKVAGMAEGVAQGASAVGETASSAAQRARETMHDMRDSVSGAASTVMQSAQGVGETVQGYASAVGGQVSQTAERTVRRAGQMSYQVKDRAASLANEQPLLVAAIGVAVGAAIAAVLPSTRIEDNIMGETSDAVKKAARGVASEQLAHATAAAGRVAEEAKTVAEREGLTPGIAADAARLIGDKVKKVVTEAAATGKSELRDMANGAIRQS